MTMDRRQKLCRFIKHPITEIAIAVLIILSIVLLILEVHSPKGSSERELYDTLGLVITGIFIIELGIRWYTSESTRIFFRTYWIDIIAVLPIIRPLRIFRILRLLRIVRVGVLFSRHSRRFSLMLHEGVMEHITLILILFGVFFLGGIGLYVLEHDNNTLNSLAKTFWFSLFTLMAGEPVGGEPHTFAGKLVTAAVMLGGFTLFAVFTGIVSAVMVSRLKNRLEAKEMELSELNNHFLICGWNRSAVVIIKELQAMDDTKSMPVVIISELENEPDFPPGKINRGLVYFVRGDYTSAEILKKAGVGRARAAVLLADKSVPRSDQDRDARTILAALTIEKLKPGIFTCAELLRRENQEHLRMAGVEDVVIGDEYTGNLIAHSSRTWGLVTIIDELLTAQWGCQFVKIPAPEQIAGLTYIEAVRWLKKNRNQLIVSVETFDDGGMKHIRTNPSSETIINSDDNLIVISGNECNE